MIDDKTKDQSGETTKPTDKRDQVNDLPQTGTSKEGEAQVKGGRQTFDKGRGRI